jgi:hypothetical protein
MIFLSASVPKAQLVWGGHPVVTTLIRHVIGKMDKHLQERITVYQTDYFKAVFPKENVFFQHIVHVPEAADKKASINAMRHQMIEQNAFKAAIFIGGMKGVEKEYEIFRNAHPEALVIPVASTGGAAKVIYEEQLQRPDTRLKDNHEYFALFQHLLEPYI